MKKTIIIRNKGKFFPEIDIDPAYLLFIGILILLLTVLFIYRTDDLKRLKDLLALIFGQPKIPEFHPPDAIKRILLP